MTTIERFLSELANLDVKLWLEDSQEADSKKVRLRCNAPQGTLSPELLTQLAERKAEIITFLQQVSLESSPISIHINAGRTKADIPLSFAQARLWFLDQLESQSATYNISAAVQMTGALDVKALEQALAEIVQRHEVLRTSFHQVNDTPAQIVSEGTSVNLLVVDLQKLPEPKHSAEVQRLAVLEAQTPFDLSKSPLMRVSLLRLGEQSHVLLLVMHHIISDAWSLGIFIKELSALYRAFLTGEPSPLLDLTIQYADFAVWQRQWLSGEVLETKLNYWKQQLAGAPPIIELPTDRPRLPHQTFQGGNREFHLEKQLTQKLKNLSQKSGVTLFMTLQAAFVTLLHQYTAQDDILIGTPIANRNHREIEPLIGFFVNTLVLRNQIPGNPTFLELLKNVQQVTLEAHEHQDVPFEQVVEALQPERNLSYSPLFQVMFAFQNARMGKLELPGLTLTPLQIDNLTAKFDLTLSMEESPEQELVGSWEYNSDLFDGETIASMAQHFQQLLLAIVTDPQQRISELNLLTEQERDQLLVEWNDTEKEYPSQKCIHELFEAQVQLTPDAVALVFEDTQLTYHELNRRGNKVAEYLLRLGVKPEVLVGLCVERSVWMVVGLLGILKAGGAYVPLDPNYPQQRLSYMLEDSQVSVLLTQQSLHDKLPNQEQVVCLDTNWQTIDTGSGENLVSGARPDNLAYVIYTSGSTGKPKGVAIEHRSTVALLAWAQEVFTPQQIAGVLASTSICFDLSIFEMFVPLCWGGKIILAENALHLPTLSGVTLINTVPSAVTELLRNNGIPKEVCTVNLAGEALQNQLVQQLYQQDTIKQVFNLYGPSEDTTYSTFALCVPTKNIGSKSSKSPSIGRPIGNTKIYILDKQLQPVPVGVEGELYIGGAGLARGYLKKANLSAEKFIPNPYSEVPGARLYKTGDLARYRPDGNVEFRGRIDNQVKLRGFRIELGEIEAVLTKHPQVQQAVVLIRENKANDKRLVGYIVASSSAPSSSQLQNELKQQLPEYMVPSAFVVMERLPLTPNGKLDFAALPAPDTAATPTENYVPPRTETQQAIADIIGAVLGQPKVGIHDNFFAMGGHSLLATLVISRMRQTFSVDMPLRDIFEYPTVATMETALAAHRLRESGLAVVAIEPVARNTNELPLSWAQQRLWFLDQFSEQSASYNIPAAVEMTGVLDVNALEQAFTEIVQRHEVLRTSFPQVNGVPMQAIAPQILVKIPVVDLQGLPAAQQSTLVQQLALADQKTSFDLSTAPLIRVKLLRLGEQSHVLLLVMHHIISDAWSLGILMKELSALYTGNLTLKHSGLPELAIQYADFAHWQRQWLSGPAYAAHLEYWQQHLAGAPPILELPTDRPRPPQVTYGGSSSKFDIEPNLSAQIKALSQTAGTTLFMTLEAAFVTLLSRYSGTDDIVIGTPIANRNHPEIEPLLGFFVNTLVLRHDLSGNPSFQELLLRVRQVALNAYAHQDVPFEQVVEALQPERNLSHSPLFQVMFVFQNAPMGQLELPG
ncbi:MAG: amino acid adenylation domain-containing protein, partial [Stigonema ocellatum SAG 48.90 = DSM 106950]|nr:amino acid adenylation domain-containing protein [Stigonema ocellatum SAG 48.90 = DSM 106950]